MSTAMRKGGGLAVLGVVLGWAALATAAPTEWDAEGRWLGGPRGGETIVEQLPNLTGGQGSDTLFYDYFGYEVWQREADNVLLTQDQTVGRVVWWGFYGADSQTNLPPDGDETMRIRFYGARPGDGLPDEGNIIYEESFLNPQRVATGRRVLVDRLPMEYRYEVDLAAPVSLMAASVWWIEIAQIGDVESLFRWENAPGILSGHAYVNDSVPDWRFASSRSFAMMLEAIPEPTTAIAVSSLAVLCAMRRRRRQPTGRHVLCPRLQAPDRRAA